MLTTIADRIESTGGRATGFDYMRIGLALAVVGWHSIATSYGYNIQTEIWSTPLRPVFGIILPMFFALSGFLVAGSLERTNTLVMFLGLRVIRIFPALVLEVLLSAFLLGPLLTQFDLQSYFTDRKCWVYLLNVFGDIHYHLPGLFLHNPTPGVVNSQLWTVPYELECYIVLAFLSLVGFAKQKKLMIFGLVFISLSFAAIHVLHTHGPDPQNFGPVYGPGLVLCFLCGVTIYCCRHDVVWNGWLASAAGLATIAFFFVPYGDYMLPVPVAYLTAYLGLLNPTKIGILRGADYSYGVYLYGYAIQQATMCIMPWARHWYLNIAICVPLSIAFAALSWHCVEKPALRWRTPLKRFEARWIAATARVQLGVARGAKMMRRLVAD